MVGFLSFLLHLSGGGHAHDAGDDGTEGNLFVQIYNFYCCCCYNWPLTILINFSNSHCSLHTSHLSLLISHVFFPNYLLFFSSAPKTCACLLTSRPKCTSVFPLTSFNLLTDQIRELCCFYLFFSLFVVVFVCPVFSSPSAPNSLLGNVR